VFVISDVITVFRYVNVFLDEDILTMMVKVGEQP
jgi:hypothetical protein